MKMEKLPKCRVCLAENVRMYVVVNKNIHELYRKLTGNPFVTADIRPMLACYLCCTELRKCCQLQRKCLAAEELFAQMMNEDYESDSSMNQDPQLFYSGFIQSPMMHISIVDECQTESDAVKDELPAVCERLDDIIEIKEEYQSDELENSYSDVEDIPAHHSESESEDGVPLLLFETEVKEEQEVSMEKRRASDTKNLENSYSDVEDIPAHHSESESESEDGVPLLLFETEVKEEQEVSMEKRRASDTKKLENSFSDVEDIPAHHSESESEDDVPLIEFETEVKEEQEVLREKRRASDTKSPSAAAAKKPKLEPQKENIENSISAMQKNNWQAHSKNSDKTKKNKSVSIKEKAISSKTVKGKPKVSKSYKCDICPRSFGTPSLLKIHIRSHTGEKPYKCDICQKTCSDLSNLKRHILLHTGEKPYKCDICQRKFGVLFSLKRHIRTHTGEKPYKCVICPRRFCEPRNLKVHIRSHTGEKPYKCDICQRSFSEPRSLKNHMRLHTAEIEKPYKCDICQRSFGVLNSLQRHIRSHTGEKPYKCDICQRKFGVLFSLKRHIRTHTGEKPYKCVICPRRFCEPRNLKVHIRSHTGEKPYKCDICQRSFSEPRSLKNHMRLHTAEIEKPYKCDICPKSFNSKNSWKKHVSKRH